MTSTLRFWNYGKNFAIELENIEWTEIYFMSSKIRIYLSKMHGLMSMIDGFDQEKVLKKGIR